MRDGVPCHRSYIRAGRRHGLHDIGDGASWVENDATKYQASHWGHEAAPMPSASHSRPSISSPLTLPVSFSRPDRHARQSNPCLCFRCAVCHPPPLRVNRSQCSYYGIWDTSLSAGPPLQSAQDGAKGKGWRGGGGCRQDVILHRQTQTLDMPQRHAPCPILPVRRPLRGPGGLR